MIGTPNRTTAWLNFAQRTREQGGLGLAPHQAAGLVGNLHHESGKDLNPWGPSGDNGSAWGTAQWRLDRLERLKQRPDYQTMEGQQAFMREELDSSENKAYRALQAAKTPEEAATAFNKLYERSADTTGNRERAARALMASFGEGGAPDTGALSYASTDNTGSTMVTPALSQDAVYGPGALNSQDGTPGILGYAMSQNTYESLKGIAAAMADDPERAKAIYAQVASSRKAPADQGTWSIHTDPNGKSVWFNNKSGRTIDRPGNFAKPKEAEKVDPSALKYVADETKAMTGLYGAAQEADKYRQAIQEGKLDLSIAGQANANWDSMFGKGTELAKLYNGFQQFRTKAANEALRQNVGTQTEGDAVRAFKELTGTFTAQFDPQSVSQALDTFIKTSGNVAHKSASNALRSYSSNYSDHPAFSPFREELDGQRKYFDEYSSRAPAQAPAQKGASGLPKGVSYIKVK